MTFETGPESGEWKWLIVVLGILTLLFTGACILGVTSGTIGI
ncbi:hypothetical protein LCGC14_1137540 [marine sediment metagenome]|uniref:Uncharacterized protein n=1 Tax=marine sediment metagenome TaxID=412755 RepID=A0A0F9Q4Y6_9ZZZZ